MKLDSLISFIKQSIITDASANVTIIDKSLLAELLGKSDDANGGKRGDVDIVYKPKYRRDVRFPLSNYVCQCLWSLATLFIAALYLLPATLLWLLTGKWKDLRSSARFNAIMFIGTVVFYIVILVFSIIFLLNSVLFFDADSHINRRGAIVMKQPCGIEHYIYLFNAAELWSNTGVELLEGDKVEISASGHFYGSVGDLIKKAESNECLKYAWNTPVGSNDSTLVRDSLLIYKGKEAKFGSLLIQICPEGNSLSYSNEDEHTIYGGKKGCKHSSLKNQMEQYSSPDETSTQHGVGSFLSKGNRKYSFEAKKAGVLYLSVNDIYLNDSALKTIKDNREKSVIKNLLGVDDTASVANLFKGQRLPTDRERRMWFDDNLGEFLVNIVVSRNTATDAGSKFVPDILPKAFREAEMVVSAGSYGNLLLCILGLIAWLLADFWINKLLRTRCKPQKNISET